MANSITTQIIQDGPRNATVKVVGILDTANASAVKVVDVTTLTQGGTAPQPTTVAIAEVTYSIDPILNVEVIWESTAPVTCLALSNSNHVKSYDYGYLQNNGGAGTTGNILLTTTGWTTGTHTFTLIFELIKQGV